MPRDNLPLPVAQLSAALTPLLVLGSTIDPAVADRAEQALRTQVGRQGRKFTKAESLYAPFTPIPPVAFRYECQTCRFWQRRGVSGPYPTCAVVGVRGDPWGGQAIHPLAWCGWWLEPRGEPPLRWAAEVLDPSLTPARGSL